MYLSPIALVGLTILIVLMVAAIARLARQNRPLPMASGNGESDPVEQEFGQIAGLHARDGLVVQDMRGIILWANPAYCKMMGYEKNEIIGRHPLSFALPPDQRLSDEDIARFRFDPQNPVYQHLGVGEISLFKNIRKSGALFWNQIGVTIHTTENGRQLALLICRDVTDQVKKEDLLREALERLQHSASYDALTGAANRSRLMEFADDALKDARNAGLSVGLMQIDLDKFKNINDIHGHAAGDAILRHVTTQAQAVLRKTDLFARMGGDEFVAVCPDLVSIEELSQISKAMREAMRQPVLWEGKELSCDVSIGAALTRQPSDTLEDLLRKSDFALYDIKTRGRGAVAVYDARLDRRQKRLSSRSNDLAEAVRSGKLEHHFQPIGEIDTGRIVAFETLARWPHPEDGLLQPPDFLPLAQHLGLMVEIDFLAFHAANRMRARLKSQGFGAIGVNINCAGSTLSHPGFRTALKRDLKKMELTPADLTLEIREAMIFDAENSRQNHVQRIHDLRNDGFPILLDEFAAGYHGLTHLNQLPIAGFKIERGMIKDIMDDPTNRKVAGMILELSADLGLIAIAEGIETTEQAVQVRELGGQLIQGHLISPALPPAQVLPWLAQRATVPWPVPSAIAPDDSPRYLRQNS